MLGSLFLRNPRLLVLTIAMIVVAGMSAFTLLPRREDPELLPRFAIITTPYPGASAARVEALVTEKIEDALREHNEKMVDEICSFLGKLTLVEPGGVVLGGEQNLGGFLS